MGAVTGNAAFSYRLYRLEMVVFAVAGLFVLNGLLLPSLALFGGTVVCFLAVSIE